jgi:hypothetical protein
MKQLKQHYHHNEIIRGYIEAVHFTDNGPDDNRADNAALTDEFIQKATTDCQQFTHAVNTGIDKGWIEFGGNSAAWPTGVQIGHDLWFTRNGHGVGFWDKPGLYGEDNAQLLTRMSDLMGEHESDWAEYGNVPRETIEYSQNNPRV